MDTILLYGLILLIGFVLGRIPSLFKKDEYIEEYNKKDDNQNNASRYYGRNEESDDEGNDDESDENEDDENGRFYFIDCKDMPEGWNFFDVIVDKVTKVQYLQDTEGYSLTPLIDSEGKPILYDGEFEE